MNSQVESLGGDVFDLPPRIAALDSSFNAKLGFKEGLPTSGPTYAEVLLSSPDPPPPTPSRPPISPRRAAAEKYNLAVVYLVVPEDHPQPVKLGDLRKQFKRHGLNVCNISLVGKKYAEVLVKDDGVVGWKENAGSVFQLLSNLDLLNIEDMRPTFPSYSGRRELLRALIKRLRHEVDTANGTRTAVKNFYRHWLNSLQPQSTPPHSP